MSQQPNRTPYESPARIRTEEFSHRVRGLDETEVRDYLDLLADQVAAADAQREAQNAELERLRAEAEHLRNENFRLREEAERGSGEISPQAVALFSQAQQVADQLVEEAVVHARDLMMSARHQQRDILQRAHDTASQVARRSGAPQIVEATAQEVQRGGYDHPVPEIEYVRTFARVAQGQLRSVLDALTEQVDRLGEVPHLDPSDDTAERPSSFALPRARSEGDPLGQGGATGPTPAEDSIYQQIWSSQGRAVE